VTHPWEDLEINAEFFEGHLEFDAIDLSVADIAELCAQCRIDHSIAPVAHTRGGSSAGYARWEEFKRHGLKSYARLRNDAAVVFPKGVSRISAYLHHGHVSPFRIAREAAATGSSGAEKFLDELLIWRELAHNFCFHHHNLESLDILPPWARQTLMDHIDDPRKTVYSWETLCRARTGDLLWDAAQKSLLIRGELHNNVRMTWGKAFLNWARDPQDALDLMIDLNHRFALDGNDANSYGGLLWCLGLFDRPFKPQRPVIGTLRPRPTKDHANRLDMAAYAAKVQGPASGKPIKIAVVGAGISGLFAARTLSDHGHRVQVFEKGDQPGGRIATQADSRYAFDSGAQYFTVRDERMERYVQSWHTNGIVQPWKGRVQVIKSGRPTSEKRITERWVGIPGMNALPKHLAAGMAIQYDVNLVSAAMVNSRWQFMDDRKNEYGPYDAVIISAPPPRAIGLVKTDLKLLESLAKVQMQPCLAVLAAFEKPLDLPFDAAFIHESAVRWAARNNSKSQRPAAECWVLHAGAEWSQTHGNEDKDTTSHLLVRAFFQRLGQTPVKPIYTHARFWRFAAAVNPLNVGSLWDARSKIGFCGDWCRMSRVEGAALSGMAIAGRVLGTIAGVSHSRKVA
jgi:predicted NAD/FAD-dependent oxidoreductase